MVTYTALKENSKKFLEKDKDLKGERPKDLKYSLGSWKDLGGNWYNHLSFFEHDPKIEIFFEKEGAAEETNVNVEIAVNASAAK